MPPKISTYDSQAAGKHPLSIRITDPIAKSITPTITSQLISKHDGGVGVGHRKAQELRFRHHPSWCDDLHRRTLVMADGAGQSRVSE